MQPLPAPQECFKANCSGDAGRVSTRRVLRSPRMDCQSVQSTAARRSRPGRHRPAPRVSRPREGLQAPFGLFFTPFSRSSLFFLKKKNKTKIILLVGLSISVLSILSEVCKVTAIPPSATRPYVEKRPVLFLRQNIKKRPKTHPRPQLAVKVELMAPNLMFE